VNGEVTAKPFLRWAGSKRQLLPKLIDLAPKTFNRYWEPFLGSGSLYFALRPERATLSDINPDLIEVFHNVKNAPTMTHNHYSFINTDRETYYTIRAIDPQTLSSVERAARFIYLNRLCFNGLYRTNLNNKFNVPYGAHKAGALPPLASIISCAEVLANAHLVHGDFESILNLTEPGDFVFLDPPYISNGTRIFKEYGPSIFMEKDVLRLVNQLHNLDDKGVKFILTFVDTKQARELFSNWRLGRAIIKRNIAGFAKDRKNKSEIVIRNY